MAVEFCLRAKIGAASAAALRTSHCATPSVTPHCAAQRHGMALHVTGMAWHGMTWHCTASHGTARHGMVSHDRAGQGRAGMSRLCHANAKREAHCSARVRSPAALVVCWRVLVPCACAFSALRSELPSRRAASFRATLCCCALRYPLAYGGMPSLLASSERQRLLCSIDAALRRVCARTSGSCVGPARAPAQARTLPRRQ